MTGQTSRTVRSLLWLWAAVILLVLYMPSICGAIASLGAGR
jgi:ABC-type spermidine/putrescine transport system permease subunit II